MEEDKEKGKRGKEESLKIRQESKVGRSKAQERERKRREGACNMRRSLWPNSSSPAARFSPSAPTQGHPSPHPSPPRDLSPSPFYTSWPPFFLPPVYSPSPSFLRSLSLISPSSPPSYSFPSPSRPPRSSRWGTNPCPPRHTLHSDASSFLFLRASIQSIIFRRHRR